MDNKPDVATALMNLRTTGSVYGAQGTGTTEGGRPDAMTALQNLRKTESVYGVGASGVPLKSDQQVTKTPILEAFENIRPNYIKKGEGSGVGGKRTAGEIYKNIGEWVGDVGVGALRGAIQLPVHIAQAYNRVLPENYRIGGENTILDPDSAQAQYFNEAMKGKTGAQKFGVTLFDIASTMLPGGPISRAGQVVGGATKAIPFVAKAGMKAGTAGKFARMIPGAVSGVAETALGAAALEGDVKPGDLAIGAASPLVSRGLKKGYNGLRMLSEKGRSAIAREEATNLLRGLGQGDPWAIGKYNQLKDDAKNAFKDIFNSSGIRMNEVLEKTGGKLKTTPEGVGETIFERVGFFGKPSELNPGFLDTKEASDALQKSLDDDFGYILDKAHKSANTLNDIRAIRKNAIDTANRVIRDPEQKKEMVKAIKDYFANRGTSKYAFGGETSDRLYQESKGMRSASFSGNDTRKGFEMDKRRIISSAIDDAIYSNPDFNKQVLGDAREEIAKILTAKNFLDKVDNRVRIPKTFSTRTAALVGGLTGGIIGGPGASGFIGQSIGHILAPELNQMIASRMVRSGAGNEVLMNLAQFQNAQKNQTLRELLNMDILKNTANKKEAQGARRLFKEVNSSLKNLTNMQKGKTAASTAKEAREVAKVIQNLNELQQYTRFNEDLLDQINRNISETEARTQSINQRNLESVLRGQPNPSTLLPSGAPTQNTNFRSVSQDTVPIRLPAKSGNRLQDYIGI